MLPSIRKLPALLMLGAAMLAAPWTTWAQTCGDVDDSGRVTVSDGIQVLRAAAFLGSACVPAVCDVDGNGSVSVGDGVATLRKAVDLPAPDGCLNVEAGRILGRVRPILEVGLGSLDIFRAEPAEGGCDNPEGLLDLQSDGNGGGTARFTTCELEGYRFDGTIVFGADSVTYDVVLTEVASGVAAAFDGTLTATFFDDGRFSVDGDLRFVSTDLGSFTVRFENVTARVNGALDILDGTLVVDPDAANAGRIDALVVAFRGAPIVDVTATLDQGGDVLYEYDLSSGSLKLKPS